MIRATLGDGLGGRDNALNSLRLVLALSVILGHTWIVGGFPGGYAGISGLAVNGFFALSGYLIAGSRVRLTLGRYLWHRALRIMPAFWVCLLVVAFVFAPISTGFTGEHWRGDSAAGFVWHNIYLRMNQLGIDHTLLSVPEPGAWNGSLWTLYFEFLAYILAGLLLTPLLVRRHRVPILFTLTGLAMLAAYLAYGPVDVTTRLYLNGVRLGAFFVAGMAMWSVIDRLPASRIVAAACALAIGILFFRPEALLFSLGPLPLAYLLLWLGGQLKVRVGATNDISYGVYIYAYPIQTLLVVTGADRWGFWPMVGLAVVLTIPLAWLSWWWIERPALLLRHTRLKRRVAIAPVSG